MQAGDHRISEDWLTMIAVFDYITPDYIQDTDTVANEPNPRKKIR
jgi:hypothetical protein